MGWSRVSRVRLAHKKRVGHGLACFLFRPKNWGLSYVKTSKFWSGQQILACFAISSFLLLFFFSFRERGFEPWILDVLIESTKRCMINEYLTLTDYATMSNDILSIHIENVKIYLLYIFKYYFIYFTNLLDNTLNIPIFIFKCNLIK